MKAPFYVIDRTRNLVFGQFFKQDSADEVAAILKHHSTDNYGSIETFGSDSWRVEYLDSDLKSKELRKGNEADIQRIAAEKYLPQRSKSVMTQGHVISVGWSRDQMVVLACETSGRKFNTWRLRNLTDGKPYTWKTKVYEATPAKFVRMATPNEFHGAQARWSEIDQRVKARADNNKASINTKDIRPGDVVTVNYSDVGHKDEVVEDINHKTGRVAIARRGAAALMHQKRRFINALNIVKVVEKGPGRFTRNNPMYAKYGVTDASTADYERANAAKTDPLSRLVSYLNIR
jgi:hypothetical protein